MATSVVQWTSGGVARQAVRAILAHPDLDLLGMYVYSPEKAGKDIGELVGLAPLGIKATNDIQALIDLRPDCVSYSPLYPNVDHLCSLLEAGINIVTTSNFLTGYALDYREEKYGPNARQRVEAAASGGNASIFGTGINPGHINYSACVLSAYCQQIRHLKVTESVDVFNFAGDPNMSQIGMGLPANTPGHGRQIEEETAVFGDAIELMARMLELPLDKITCSVEFAHATEAIAAPGCPIKAGCVAGVRVRWQGYSDGQARLENEQIWVVGDKTDALWTVQHGYIVNIQGDPNILDTMLPIPNGDLAKMTPSDLNAVGMRITALPSINAIKAVCAAPAGICTYNELPAISGRKRSSP